MRLGKWLDEVFTIKIGGTTRYDPSVLLYHNINKREWLTSLLVNDFSFNTSGFQPAQTRNSKYKIATKKAIQFLNILI
jgi:hypothetical protein